jgi:hypothetical protein
VFLEIATARVGPFTVGYGDSEVEGIQGVSKWFFLLSPERMPWPGPFHPRGGL